MANWLNFLIDGAQKKWKLKAQSNEIYNVLAVCHDTENGPLSLGAKLVDVIFYEDR